MAITVITNCATHFFSYIYINLNLDTLNLNTSPWWYVLYIHTTQEILKQVYTKCPLYAGHNLDANDTAAKNSCEGFHCLCLHSPK